MVQFPFARGRAFVCKNIGDYVQSIASRQYIDVIDEYVEQEEANEYYPKDNRKIKLIMNGWFQWRAENFPPSEFIEPLLISMHISPLRAQKLLTPAGIEFLKKHAPVGCRDLWTKNLLESKGIPAYFSARLTLTFGKNYSVPLTERKGIYIVDPYFSIPNLNFKRLLSSLSSFVKNFGTIVSLAKRPFFKDYSPTGFLDRNRNFYRPFYKAILFYETYSKKFDDDILLNAEYITHWLDVDMSKDDNDYLLGIAENLVKKYAAAQLVITSRIHAGLPALGLDTPVIFIANHEVTADNGNFNTPGRLSGLIELFRVFNLEDDEFKTDDEIFSTIGKFDLNTKFQNKTGWKYYAAKLSKKCQEFMGG